MAAQNKITVSWVVIGEQSYAVAFNQGAQTIIYELLDYSIHLSKRIALSPLTVRNTVYHLTPFLSWLADNKLSIDSVTDGYLESFRDYELSRLQSASSRSTKAHKRTINARLVSIYQYLVWIQWMSPALHDLIGGSRAQVTSNLRCDAPGRIIRSKYKVQGLYPILFPDAGSGARHRNAHEASEGECDSIKKHFVASHNSFVASRNILMMDIMDQVGLRRGAVNSLRCAQFDMEDDFFDGHEFLKIVPDAQKFSYQRSFDFPALLVYRIQGFISTHRAWLVRDKGLTTHETCDRIFISSTTGKPLNNVSVSCVFSTAFDNIGVTNRASCHAFRHKYVSDTIHDEIVMRKNAGVDTSDASIAFAVAPKLGQANPASLLPYVASGQIKLASTLRKENQELKELRLENARLKLLLEEHGE